MDIVMLVGSLREGSWTAQLADAVGGLLPEGVTAWRYAALADLPHYSQDLDVEDGAPMAVTAFRRAVERADGLVVVTPEYNGSLPGVLKNAIDWASRPRGASALDGKPAAVVSVSPSPRGAQWAREDAEKVLRVAGARPLATSVGVATVHEALQDGAVAHPDVRRELEALAADLVGSMREDATAAA